jgi:hypothetical protein
MEHGKSLRNLARQGVVHVDLCDCGMIYFGIGPVTVKLSKEAFEQVVRGAAAAERALNHPPTSGAGNVLSFGPRLLPTQ